MKINEVEQLVGITKKNIRFYEEQGLITPQRNKENGYRNYSEADVLLLQKIKLLRMLSVPIEEIRKLETNLLTLSECMERHTILLAHQKRNLELVREICEDISANESSLSGLAPLVYLEKMKMLEEGGTRFMSVETKDTGRKKIGPVIAAGCMLVLMIWILGFCLWGYAVDPIPIGLLLFLLAIPVVIMIGVVAALVQRLKEIERGEEDEASKY